jgi:hypothetical protein
LIYRVEGTVEAEDAVSACRTAISSANESDAWKALDWEQRTYISALAAGADVDPWRVVPDGEDCSVLPVPSLFSDVTMLAGYAANRSEDLVDQLRIMIDAIDADGGLRITPTAMVRLCATGKAILDDIDGFGLSSNPNAATPVVAVAPDAT